ncbi:MAG: transposase [Flavobacteriales bacterium]|nr:transposase [Flavobacteriales bacterium]MBK7943672.1 transposase [Flavobacteriales bacterium]MBK8950518.1 transposase [Flavobacteriales bacterium]MBK9699644.1 transposase [Flavobacteriales bacterium]
MSRKYTMHDPEGLYFLSFATVGWIDVLTRREYKDVVVESLRFCQEQKGLDLFEWVIMTNHVHLLARAKPGSALSDIIRDLKKYTSGTIHRMIEQSATESRKAWMLDLLHAAGESNGGNSGFQLWQQHNKPLLMDTPEAIDRVVAYIRENPVKEGFVAKAEDHVYGSAHEPGLLELEKE